MTTVSIEVAASISAIVHTWLYGNKSIWGPTLGMVGVILFCIIMVAHGLWGLAPLNLFAFIAHGRNFRKWRKEGAPLLPSRWRVRLLQRKAARRSAAHKHSH